MEPGRELDALIAQRHGWKWMKRRVLGGRILAALVPPNDAAGGAAWDKAVPATVDDPRGTDWDNVYWEIEEPDSIEGFYGFPLFSTAMAAWTTLLPHSFGVAHVGNYGGEELWIAGPVGWYRGRMETLITVKGQSKHGPAHAICLALLATEE